MRDAQPNPTTDPPIAVQATLLMHLEDPRESRPRRDGCKSREGLVPRGTGPERMGAIGAARTSRPPKQCDIRMRPIDECKRRPASEAD